MINNQNFSTGQDIPLGLSMAMAQNPNALNYFANLSPKQKQSIIDNAHEIRSKAEMKQFVDSMAHNEIPKHNNIF